MSQPDVDHFLNIARLGIDAEAFLATPLGKHLNAKAQAELDAAMNELVAADPDDVKLNRDIRNRIHVVGMLLKWLEETITGGKEAHRQLMDMDDRGKFPE